MPKSYMLYRIIANCGLGVDKYELYKKYCNKLQLPEHYFYWQDMDSQVLKGVSDKPRKDKLFQLISCFIPSKTARRRFREKNKGTAWHCFEKIFGEGNV